MSITLAENKTSDALQETYYFSISVIEPFSFDLKEIEEEVIPEEVE